jgi:gas vesicle structural protein
MSDRDYEEEELELSDLLNRVLDKGVVISGTVTLAVANIDLVRLELNLLLSAFETELQRGNSRSMTRNAPPSGAVPDGRAPGSLAGAMNANVPVRRPPGGE